jgi:hypothetical protein
MAIDKSPLIIDPSSFLPITMRLSFVSLMVPALFVTAQAQPLKVNFDYAPSRHLTAICFPDDWQKTMVTETGALAYDFGPGPYARPLTTVSVEVQGEATKILGQRFDDPKVPIAVTRIAAGTTELEQRAFALAPSLRSPTSPLQSPPSSAAPSRVIRLGGLTGCVSWANPDSSVDPVFHNVAWGTNRPVLYRVRVTPSSQHRVALGLCESYKGRPRSRLQELHVEGANSMIVDPLSDSTRNRPYVFFFDGHDADGDGLLNIEAHAAPSGPDPNVILNAFWVFPEGTLVDADGLITGRFTQKAEVAYSCGRELEETASAPRMDGILSTVTGGSARQVVRIRTVRQLAYDAHRHMMTWEGRPYLLTRPAAVAAVRETDGWTLEMPAHATEIEAIAIHGPRSMQGFRAIPDLKIEMQRAVNHWSKLKYRSRGKISVPDTGIQYVLDASIRNVYQIRESVDGHMQLQPGPTVYRGMWVGDLILSGVPVMMLGDTSTERKFLESALRFQLPDGRIRVGGPYNTLSETPFTLLAMFLYARSAGNDRWLITHWSALQKGFEWIHRQRESTLADSHTPYRGLMPPSFVDGGLRDESADYGTVWWSLVALEKAIEAAQRIGKTDDAAAWKTLFSDLDRSYRAAASRDLRTVGSRRFLSIGVGDTSTTSPPQRGQYTFLMPVRYGRMFSATDSLTLDMIRSNLNMLDRASVEGLIQGSGWMAEGVWPWLGGVHGIAHNLVGSRRRAAELLYAFANHASPLGTWVEEQQPKHLGNGIAGDASNAEASAVFVHLVRDLLVVERGGTLELLRGAPDEWYRENATIELRDILTEFGAVQFRLRIDKHSARTHMEITVPRRKDASAPALLHLEALKKRGFMFKDGQSLPEILEIGWGRTTQIELVRAE